MVFLRWELSKEWNFWWQVPLMKVDTLVCVFLLEICPPDARSDCGGPLFVSGPVVDPAVNPVL